MSGAECSAPFLSNPYVNMGMYVAYYWTTLVAMLILYKGIHQAAKNLEKKAKAKERRHIALILSQRLGTQVGVSLMLQSRAEKEKKEEAQKDSGYQTTTVAGSGNTESELNLGTIEEEKSCIEIFGRRESEESYFPAPHPTANNSRRCSEMEKMSLLSHGTDDAGGRSVVRTAGRASESVNEQDDEQGEKSDSLRKLFNDDELSSVLNFKEPLKQADSNNDSDTTSVIVKHSQFEKNKRLRSSRKSGHGTPRRIAQLKNAESVSHAVQVDAPNNDEQQTEMEPKRPERWVFSMKRRIAKALVRKNTQRESERRASSSSDDSSSETEANNAPNADQNTRLTVPQLTISSDRRGSGENDRLAPTTKTETFLSASGVSRKISSLSTAITRERVISSIFAPIGVFNRGRKQTKAEKRAHKAFRTITFIVGFFAILWSPYYIMATVYGFCKGECIPSFLYTLSYYMCYLNSSGNPFAYALANRQFRSAFLRMLRGNFNKVA
ncbi:unnamed protein product [Caenorhabditis auriculariae]|uniref:G-protein coupled receptors family 1 profile domain-containing protein n=1 Tax=Caenorhabditis auriculariae TaxID=2777116 RepID=A0A8S1GN84_9PELO|nr:unnamed protein product [Caenorhabditis auriculariae]